jgi:hypothetical protein
MRPGNWLKWRVILTFVAAVYQLQSHFAMGDIADNNTIASE